MRLARCLAVIAAFVLLAGGAGAAGGAEPAWSTQRLVANKADWDQMVGTMLRVEGRIASSARNQLRLARCDLPFHLSDEQGRQAVNAKNVELHGRILREKDTGKLYFDVTYLKPLPTDADQLQSREAALKNPSADEWFALGEWANERGRFYEDQLLVDSARLCFTRGLALELRDLSKDDIEGRFRLVTKSRERRLPDSFADEILHEAFRAWWNRATTGKPSADDLQALLQRVSLDWPSSLTPAKSWPTDLQESYLQDPLRTYHQADAGQRSILQRLFAAQVQLRQITAKASPDGKNAGEIAAEIERLVPERRSLAMQYRDQELKYRQSHIATASKAEAVQLAEAFRQRQREDLAVDTLRRWLAARSQAIAKTGSAPEYLVLADDYWTLLKDEPATVALLEKARQREPESEDVETRFRELGYEWTGSRWARPGAITPEPAPTPTSSPPSALAVGLTTAEVRQLQGGPSTVATLVSGSGVDEFWTYGEATGSRLVIQFSRRLHQSEARVVKFYQR